MCAFGCDEFVAIRPQITVVGGESVDLHPLILIAEAGLYFAHVYLIAVFASRMCSEMLADVFTVGGGQMPRHIRQSRWTPGDELGLPVRESRG